MLYLAAVQDGVGGVVPVRTARRIDPDHFGTLVGQHHRHGRAGDVLPEVDDPDPLERTFRGGGFHGLESFAIDYSTAG